MNEEKEILTAENDRLSEESVWLVYLVSVIFKHINICLFSQGSTQGVFRKVDRLSSKW